ncbi:MAG: hypothetical protein SFY32_09780 [Bacteroidota bacterium]|nr:hypothetical protein [Bacteroidota bacterium]
MQISDLFLTPVYLFILFQVLFMIRKKECGKSIIKKYFIPAAFAKVIGSICLGLIYYFYYKGGDTVAFHKGVEIMYKIFQEDPVLWFQTLVRNCEVRMTPEQYKYFTIYPYIYDNASFFVIRICSLFAIIDFNSYTVNAILLGMFSFSGSWALFKTFLYEYPELHKQLSYAIFFIPSVVFWGSGMLKDTITFGALGWLVFAFYQLFIIRNFNLKNWVIFTISVFLLVHIKIYILMSFVPAMVIWLFLTYNQKIKSVITRLLFVPLLIIFSMYLGLFVTQKLAEQDDQYKFENLGNKAKITNEWLAYLTKSQNGSYYDLGEIEYTPLGMLKVFPKAVNVSLFRPYLWESKNPVMLLAALESTFFLLFTLYAIFNVGLKNILSVLWQNHMVISFLIFSIGLSFAVGLTSTNFGTLVRYKIPIMPFYIISIYLINIKAVPKREHIIAIKT